MFKKYIKLALLFYAPLLFSTLNRMMDVASRDYTTTSSSSMYGNIGYPSLPDFGSYFMKTLLLLYAVMALYSLFVFSELRGQKTGGFIDSLPIKKSAVYVSLFLPGCLLIVLSFLPMSIFFFYKLNQISPDVYAAFSAHNRIDWAEELIFKTRQSNISVILRTLSVTLCLYAALTFVQTMFQKPIAALCALVGGLGGSVLCLMTLDKYLIVLGYKEGISTWLGGRRFGYFLSASFFEDNPGSMMRFMFLMGVITAVVFAAGLKLYQKGGYSGDFIFAFPAVKKIMIAGITLCSGCLGVYLLFLVVGLKGLHLGQMNMLFIAGSSCAFILARKMFNILC